MTDKRERKLNELEQILDNNEDSKNIEYFKAYIQFYQVYYDIDLDEAQRNASGDLMHCDDFDDCIGTLIDAYYELKKLNKN